ncbi:MAG: alpha/beta hydrolase [Pseudomonadota bacterium]
MKPHIFHLGQSPDSALNILFAHANGYPPGSYRALLEPLQRDYSVWVIEHRPLWDGREPPERLSWSVFVDDLRAAIEEIAVPSLHLMGHSMGATCATLLAAQHPGLVTSLLLLDPVFLPDRLILASRFAGRKSMEKFPLVRGALRRPEYFADQQQAFRFYRNKRAFKKFSDEALQDFVDASNEPMPDGRVRLRYSGQWEAAVYMSGPRIKPALKSLKLPVLGLRGEDTDTLSESMWARWAKWQPEAVLKEVPGGHLFPMEHPTEALVLIQSFLSEQASAESLADRIAV